MPLDIELAPTFKRLNMQLRNRIIWQYGHGLHSQRRFSGRYETVMWYTKTDDYHFDLDPVRVPSKYPGKKHYRGPKKGQYSGNANGKNPEDGGATILIAGTIELGGFTLTVDTQAEVENKLDGNL